MKICGNTMTILSVITCLGTASLTIFYDHVAHAYSFVIPKSLLPLHSRRWGFTKMTGQITVATFTRTKVGDRSRSLAMKKKASGMKNPCRLSSFFHKPSSYSMVSMHKIPNSTTKQSRLEPHPSQRDHISPLNFLYHDNIRPTLLDALPVHLAVSSGVLHNGLSYIILPNKSPPNRFEAHLQVFSGSADELEQQQGIAHLTEHVAYMGSRKRERLFGTGSQTNAYTDFHHTVFYAACPTTTPRAVGVQGCIKPIQMLPLALDALCDVMEAKLESARLEKERAAVLSEMTMVNTIEYRVECQILGTLHRENRLAKRFPIGKEELIRNWNRDDVKTWHRMHYRPDNVLVYIVGDIDPVEAEHFVEEKFGHISAEKQGSEIAIPELKVKASKLACAIVGYDDVVKSGQSWHYPPVRHDFCVPLGSDVNIVNRRRIKQRRKGREEENINMADYDLHLQGGNELDENVNILTTNEVAPGKKIRPHIFRHELLQAFSFHLFAKRPVEPIIDLLSFRRSLSRRVALAALQIRLNVGGRSNDSAFTFAEFNQLDSSREGCAICSLDMTAESYKWMDAIRKSLMEIRKMGKYGVTPGEMKRYSSALMTDAEQLAAQGDRISHGKQLSCLMESVANGHTFMSPEQSYVVTTKALSTLTLDEVNNAARDLCSHITSFNDSEDPADGIVIVIACLPKGPEVGNEAYCDEESLVRTIYDACQDEVDPEDDIFIPHTIISEKELQNAVKKMPPSWKCGSFCDGTPDTSSDKITQPFTLRRLGNGIRIGVVKNDVESQRGYLRLVAPGGRNAERRLGFKSGSMAVGAKCMQEGGALGPWTREQVELFCIDHLLMVDINCNEESLILDFVFPTTNVANVGFGDEIQLGITGTEAVLQIVREIIVGFHWEEDALVRSKQSFRNAHESLQKTLEGKTTEMIMESMTNHDERFLSIDVPTVNAIALADAKRAVMSQLLPPELEVSVAGDFDVEEILDMILKYLGTIPGNTNVEYHVKGLDDPNTFGSVPSLRAPGKFLELELADSDPRAISYVAGAAPNQWGYLADGTTVAERVKKADKNANNYDVKRISHPLFANVALSILAEIVNRRLFSTVRERRQLTYDANFSLTGFERLKGGWFLVTVTASKEKAQAALEACKETLEAMRKTNPITSDNLESAKRVVVNRHESELRTSSYWATIMSGLQQESIPSKGPLSVTDYHAVIESITIKDMQHTLECFGLNDSELYTAIGRTIEPDGYKSHEEIDKISSMAGMGKAGALKG